MTEDEYTPLLAPFSEADETEILDMMAHYALSLDDDKFKLFMESI